MIKPVTLLFFTLGSFLAKGQYPGIRPGSHYIELGAGASVYNNSHVKNASQDRLSVLLYSEIGKFKDIFSLVGGYDFRTSYAIDAFQLRTNFIFLHLRVDFFNLPVGSHNFTIFGFAGPNYHWSSLVLTSDDPIVIEQREVKNGTGITGGVGAGLALGRWTVASKALLVRSHNSFFGGAFGESKYQTGSERVQLTVGRKIKDNKSYETKCATYR